MWSAAMWLNLYGHKAVRRKLKKGVNTKNAFLPFFWAYMGQPDDHIGWATLLPYASIYSTHLKGPIPGMLQGLKIWGGRVMCVAKNHSY